jgi:hypothetical protein
MRDHPSKGKRHHRRRSAEIHPGKILRLFAEVQDHLYHGNTIKRYLEQLARHTNDPKILETCDAIAELLSISIEKEFSHIDKGWRVDAVNRLKAHSRWATDKYREVRQEVPEYDSAWTEPILAIMDPQLARLSQLIILLDTEPAICDSQGNVIYVNDLVVVPCEDTEGRPYEHYGVVRPTPSGYHIAHFFTGDTVKLRNRVSDVGIGYVHFIAYSDEWLFKERSEVIREDQIHARISNSQEKIRKGEDNLWNKLTYNCEHWAREMVSGQPRSTQIEKLRQRPTRQTE